VFGRLGVVSPSVWWDDRLMVKRVAALPKKLSSRIWVDIGSEEGDGVRDAAKLCEALVGKGWSLGKDLVFYNEQGGQHNEDSWARRFGLLLRFLFG
jgi:predicted alpha/beta superfamily hydrolase